MSRALAIVRANWLTALSYRLETMFSFLGLFIAVVPLYFVSHALQPMMASTIKAEAPEYFGFLIVGWVALSFVNTAVTGFVPASLAVILPNRPWLSWSGPAA